MSSFEENVQYCSQHTSSLAQIVVENNDYSYGRASSIKSGIRKSHFDTDCFVILGVDQPRNSEIISSLINSHLQSESLITSPRYLGNGGHPIIISSKLRDELLNIDGSSLTSA